MDDFKISKIKEDERGLLIALLNEASLSVSDLPEKLEHFYFAKKGEKVIGSIGLEVYGTLGFLRSMVVTKGMQGEGIGKVLLDQLISKAAASEVGIDEIYLITENAASFFKSAGFEIVSRETVPSIIKDIPQFKSICPTSAAVMKRKVK